MDFHERYPKARPRTISANGPEFMAGDFKDYIRLCGLAHVLISPGSPQSNFKIKQ